MLGHGLGRTDEAALWLLGVARWVLANQARGHLRWARLVRRMAEQGPPAPAAGNPDLSAALARLSPADHEVLRLAYWDELPHRDGHGHALDSTAVDCTASATTDAQVGFSLTGSSGSWIAARA